MATAIDTFPETSLQVLEHLHTYRFLTAGQLVRLGVTAQLSSLRRALKRFDPGRKCVAAVEFGALPKLGRLPRIHYLTKHGARYLAEAWQVAPEAIDYPKGAKLFVRDYFHRRATIDFEIELRLFAERHGAAVEFFHRYFDTEGANRNADPEDRLRRLSKAPWGRALLASRSSQHLESQVRALGNPPARFSQARPCSRPPRRADSHAQTGPKRIVQAVDSFALKPIVSDFRVL